MDEFIEILIAQNPTTNLNCDYCNAEIKVDSRKFFDAGDTYSFVCQNCGKTTHIIGIESWISAEKEAMKKSGYSWD